MRNEDWLQRILYLIMAVLAIYIICKGGSLLLASKPVQNAMSDGNLQRPLVDAAMRTYAPGYTATVEGRTGENWIAEWMKPVVPVYSYLAEEDGKHEEAVQNQSEGTEGTESTTSAVSEDKIVRSNEGYSENGENEKLENDAELKEMDSGADGSNLLEETVITAENGMKKLEEDLAVDENKREESGLREKEEDKGVKSGGQESVEQWTETEDQEVIMQEESTQEAAVQAVLSQVISPTLREQLSDFDYLLANYYTVDAGTTADADLLDADTLLSTDLSLEQNPDVPQILIYHTHSQEAFVDSREGEVEDTIVGMGEVLAEHLRAYGYNVIHDTGVYDLVDGVLDRSAAYDYARASVEQILADNPTIEVILDLHRDGVDGTKFVTEIGGKPTSRIMFFNGISRNSQDQALSWLPNENLEENLAFSLQLQLLADELYPDFTRNIYLKAERFNLHLRPRSLLIEAGTQLNTVEEERNAMEPLAYLIYQVLGKENAATD